MTEEEIRTTVLRVLASIAPELDPAAIRPDVSFRDQLDIHGRRGAGCPATLILSSG